MHLLMRRLWERITNDCYVQDFLPTIESGGLIEHIERSEDLD
jgi:hypothetical protein